jgi:hypothetical protein
MLRDGVKPTESLGKGSRKEEKFGSADRAHPWEAAEYSDAGETVKHALQRSESFFESDGFAPMS